LRGTVSWPARALTSESSYQTLIHRWLRASSTDIRLSGSITNICTRRSRANDAIYLIDRFIYKQRKIKDKPVNLLGSEFGRNNLSSE